MRRHKTATLVFLWFVVLLVGCGERAGGSLVTQPTTQASATTSPTPTSPTPTDPIISAPATTAASAPSTTVTRDEAFTSLGQALTVADPQIDLVRGTIVSSADGQFELVVFDQLRAGPGAPLWDGGAMVAIPHERDFDPAGAAALVGISSEGNAVLFYELDASLLRFAREPTVLAVGPTAAIAEGIDEGRMVATLPGVTDPLLFSYCQEPRTLRFDASAPDEVGAFVEFSIQYEDLVVEREEHRRLLAQADDLAERRVHRDDVTGMLTTAWVADVRDQVERGVGIDDIEFYPTVPVLLEAGNLEWVAGGATVVFAEAGTGRLLGWLDYDGHTSDDVPLEADIVDVMVPPTGAAVEVYVGELEDRKGNAWRLQE